MFEPETVRRYARQIDAMVASVDDPESFAIMRELLDSAEVYLAMAADKLRKDDGYSWADLARPLGVTRDAVAKRYRI